MDTILPRSIQTKCILSRNHNPNNETATKEYIISTDPTLHSFSAINTVFAQEYMYWAKPLSEPVLKEMVDHSLCFGPNSSSTPNTDTNTNTTNLTQIGLARIITDNTTFAYLTDVYILPEHQGAGLGSWLLQCVTEWVDSRGDSFRRFMLVTVGERAEGYYRRVMGAEVQGRKGEVFVMAKKGRGGSV
ncbi:hypothetical protein PABG_05815 [Paracoccidioides brasiliensis Pb03]|nr:hypothetical protein PABG_05815 [Paracoccidioides brasiliensis Pb03]